jgi:hypothetical protein
VELMGQGISSRLRMKWRGRLGKGVVEDTWRNVWLRVDGREEDVGFRGYVLPSCTSIVFP